MRNYYEKGDEVMLTTRSKHTLHRLLDEYGYKDKKGRSIIIDDILDQHVGIIKAVKEGTGHKEVLYRPQFHTNSWWLPTTIIKPLNN